MVRAGYYNFGGTPDSQEFYNAGDMSSMSIGGGVGVSTPTAKKKKKKKSLINTAYSVEKEVKKITPTFADITEKKPAMRRSGGSGRRSLMG